MNLYPFMESLFEGSVLLLLPFNRDLYLSPPGCLSTTTIRYGGINLGEGPARGRGTCLQHTTTIVD